MLAIETGVVDDVTRVPESAGVAELGGERLSTVGE
jgi:hypothetical protein